MPITGTTISALQEQDNVNRSPACTSTPAALMSAASE
jgi:hypothetical protein